MQKRFYFYLLISFLGFLEASSVFANSLSAPPPGRKDYVNRHEVRLAKDPRVLYLKQKQQMCLIPGSCEPKKEEPTRYPNRLRAQTPQQRLIQSLRR